MEHVFRWLFPFCGVGGGALGFLGESVRLLGQTGRIECIGGLDFDPVACRTFERFTGSPARCVDVQDVTGEDLIRWYGVRAPWGVFLSPPCKGSSRLLSSAKAETAKYQAMNRLSIAWMRAMLDAWGHVASDQDLCRDAARFVHVAPCDARVRLAETEIRGSRALQITFVAVDG